MLDIHPSLAGAGHRDQCLTSIGEMVDYFPSHPTRTMSREKLTILEDTLVRKLSEHLKVAPHSGAALHAQVARCPFSNP